ncbi:hypothetical protein A7982_13739 [Minicystis rosea]|nr:hypothetical protein A7982_13739 [Minicystis rosea]
MANDEEDRLVPNDPESEACFEALKERLAEELGARVAFGDDPRTPEGCDVLSGLIADVLLDFFVVRERKEPRYRGRAPR